MLNVNDLSLLINSERKKPMEILNITLGGFKNIKKVRLSFQNIIALVSTNSYGKSNVLNAIEFGIDFIRNDEEIKSNMMSWSKAIPLNKTMASDNFFIEFEMTTNLKDKRYLVNYGYEFRWVRDDDTGSKIINEWLKIKLDEKNQKFNNYVSRTENKGFYKSSESGRCNNVIKAEESELLINKLKAYDTLYYWEIIKKINNLNMYIERHLDASESYTPNPLIRKDLEALQIGSSNNIPRTIYHIKKKYPDKFEILIDSFKLLFPKIVDVIVDKSEVKSEIQSHIPENLPFKIDNEVYFLYVIDENINQPLSFESISDGAKRVFLVLTSLLLADINGYSLIAIEEPENSIHPALLQRYLRVLSQFIVGCKVIMTSHSPYIIQYLEPDDIYIGIPHSDGIASFSSIRKSATKSLISDANSMGMSTGDYIFELLSGADNDLMTLKQYLEEQ